METLYKVCKKIYGIISNIIKLFLYVCGYTCVLRIDSKTTWLKRMAFGTELLYVSGNILVYIYFWWKSSLIRWLGLIKLNGLKREKMTFYLPRVSSSAPRLNRRLLLFVVVSSGTEISGSPDDVMSYTCYIQMVKEHIHVLGNYSVSNYGTYA